MKSNILNFFRNLFVSQSLSEKHGLSDADLLIAILSILPSQARIEFDQAEPEIWVEKLRDWSFRRDPDQFEADYYTVTREFIQTFTQLISESPSLADGCPHISASDKEGKLLFSSLDNFCVTDLEASFEKALMERLRNR